MGYSCSEGIVLAPETSGWAQPLPLEFSGALIHPGRNLKPPWPCAESGFSSIAGRKQQLLLPQGQLRVVPNPVEQRNCFNISLCILNYGKIWMCQCVCDPHSILMLQNASKASYREGKQGSLLISREFSKGKFPGHKGLWNLDSQNELINPAK